MTSSDQSTSSTLSVAACDDHKRTVDEAFLNKMKSLVERLRRENATLTKDLDTERSGVRALKAQQEATLRNLKTEHKKREEILEKQLRVTSKDDKVNDAQGKGAELNKLIAEVQSLKAVNKGLLEKVKVSQSAEGARAAELRAAAAKHAALQRAGARDARAQTMKLLEELKSKERTIIQLKREVTRVTGQEYDQAQRMDVKAAKLTKTSEVDQERGKIKRENSKTDIQHRKETFHKERSPSDEDSAMSSGPTSLSSHPAADMWACTACRAAEQRAAAAARESTRLADALRDARDQLELMEFRLLELEDAAPDKGPPDTLTDTDSGCVSPGSRLKDSASPELKRTDSGYKSPHGSPRSTRRGGSHDEFREEFAHAQALAGVVDRSADTTDSPRPAQLEQLVLSAAAGDRACLERALRLLCTAPGDPEEYQAKPKKYDAKPRTDEVHKAQKAVATVTPYSQQEKEYKLEAFDNLCERKPHCALQESGIFDEVESESKETQTDNDIIEYTGDLNTEIQRLNSIREKLERQGRGRSFAKEDADSLECRCVKLGKKHKQYYERRLKFLEGKISIYEAAEDVKKAKLAERLQKEFVLENRIQELETHVSDLQDKLARLEEDCCELEEIENDTRLHWQQLEMEYELCAAQLRDTTEQREGARAQAERLAAEIRELEREMSEREDGLQTSLQALESLMPALVAFNVYHLCRASGWPAGQQAIPDPGYSRNTQIVARTSSGAKYVYIDDRASKQPRALKDKATEGDGKSTSDGQTKEDQLARERAKKHRQELEKRIKELEDELKILRKESRTRAKRPVASRAVQAQVDDVCASHRGKSCGAEVREYQKREAAYLEMLTEADDMWAEMEGGFKAKLSEADEREKCLKAKMEKLEADRDKWRRSMEPLKKKLKEVEESESVLRITLDKAERDNAALKTGQENLTLMLKKAEEAAKSADADLAKLQANFQKELQQIRKVTKSYKDELKTQRDSSKISEKKLLSDIDAVRRDLNTCYKCNEDLETTNCELREEVESLEKQLTLMQKTVQQCKRRCDEKVKTLSHELSIKTEELEEMRSETMRQSLHASRMDLKPERTEYVDEGYSVCTAVPKRFYGRSHHSMGYISDGRCSCPSMRSNLVGQLIEDLFDRIHNNPDDDLTKLCREIVPLKGSVATPDTKAKITNYLLMAISKELVRSIGDADAKTDTEEWQRAISSLTYSLPAYGASAAYPSLRDGNAGVLQGAARLASVACACAAARVCAAKPELADDVKRCQEEVLDHSDVKVMEEQLANAIESIVNCPSCALGTNSIIWSTDV